MRRARSPIALVIWPCLVSLLLLAAAPLRADDWEDPRRDRLESEIRELEGSPPTVLHDGESLLTLRHGDVHLVADLARVDLTLEVRNGTADRMEWQRTFTMDPKAHAIGATLLRESAPPIEARTLTLEGARRIYAETRSPPTPRFPERWGRTRDPLRVERLQLDTLDVHVWPIEPGETVRVRLTFVTPLRGRGDLRTYVDVLGLASEPVRERPVRRPATTPRRVPGASAAAGGAVEDEWLFRPGALVLAAVPVGLSPAGAAGGVLRFVADARLPRERTPTVDFRAPEVGEEAIAVKGGGLGTRVAVWRLDPALWLERRGITPAPGMTLRVLRRAGSTSRIAPWTFDAFDEPVPVTARLVPGTDEVRYAIEVRSADGAVLGTFEESRPLARPPIDDALEGAITGWHRAALAGRVLDWAGADASRRAEALAYAVDLGVLVPGTAALALPRDEQRQLARPSRREYRTDGVQLGAPRGEADLKAPPSGSLSP